MIVMKKTVFMLLVLGVFLISSLFVVKNLNDNEPPKSAKLVYDLPNNGFHRKNIKKEV